MMPRHAPVSDGQIIAVVTIGFFGVEIRHRPAFDLLLRQADGIRCDPIGPDNAVVRVLVPDHRRSGIEDELQFIAKLGHLERGSLAFCDVQCRAVWPVDLP